MLSQPSHWAFRGIAAKKFQTERNALGAEYLSVDASNEKSEACSCLAPDSCCLGSGKGLLACVKVKPQHLTERLNRKFQVLEFKAPSMFRLLDHFPLDVRLVHLLSPSC